MTKINEAIAPEHRENDISGKIIGAAIEVHKKLGPGLLESAYEECLCCEMQLRGIEFKRQVPLSLNYKGIVLDCGYRLDLLVEQAVIVEIKVVQMLEPIHSAQLLTYLRLTGLTSGLLLNFNETTLKQGIQRVSNSLRPSAFSAPPRDIFSLSTMSQNKSKSSRESLI